MYLGYRNCVKELVFLSEKKYENPYNVDVDVIFTDNRGSEIKVPCFWDGDNVFKCRFQCTAFAFVMLMAEHSAFLEVFDRFKWFLMLCVAAIINYYYVFKSSLCQPVYNRQKFIVWIERRKNNRRVFNA